MYQMQVTVREYIGCYGARAAISETLDDGSTHLLAVAEEAFFEPVSQGGDPVMECLETLRMFGYVQINGRRVASGVSPKNRQG